MANLSEAIQSGSAQQERFGSTLSAQGKTLQDVTSMGSKDMLQQQAMKMQVQENVDLKGGALMSVGLEKNKPVSAAKKALETATATGDEDGIAKAQILLDAARVERNAYIMDLTRSPAAVATLNNMSMADEDIQNNLFNADVFDSLTPKEKDEYTARWTMYAMAQERQQLEYAEAQGDIQKEKTRGTIEAYQEAGLQAPGQTSAKPAVDYTAQAGDMLGDKTVESALMSQGFKEADVEGASAIFRRTRAALGGVDPKQMVLDAGTETFTKLMEASYAEWKTGGTATPSEVLSDVEDGLELLGQTEMAPANAQYYKALLEGYRDVLATDDKKLIGAYVDLTKTLFPKKAPQLRASAGGS